VWDPNVVREKIDKRLRSQRAALLREGKNFIDLGAKVKAQWMSVYSYGGGGGGGGGRVERGLILAGLGYRKAS